MSMVHALDVKISNYVNYCRYIWCILLLLYIVKCSSFKTFIKNNCVCACGASRVVYFYTRAPIFSKCLLLCGAWRLRVCLCFCDGCISVL